MKRVETIYGFAAVRRDWRTGPGYAEGPEYIDLTTFHQVQQAAEELAAEGSKVSGVGRVVRLAPVAIVEMTDRPPLE